MKLLVSLLCTVICYTSVSANTEKVIFVAPESVEIPSLQPNFDALQLQSLTQTAPQLRKFVEVAFPAAGQERGLQSWYLLDGLNPRQRYEVRVCWVAIQPTQFWLHTFTISEVFDTPDLISGLAAYSESRLALTETATGTEQVFETFAQPDLPANRSLLFLRLYAAADFFTTNQSLMSDPPAVLIDLILDPYLLNVLPKSLFPTAIYITLVAIGSWYLSGIVWTWLHDLAAEDVKPHSE